MRGVSSNQFASIWLRGGLRAFRILISNFDIPLDKLWCESHCRWCIACTPVSSRVYRCLPVISVRMHPPSRFIETRRWCSITDTLPGPFSRLKATKSAQFVWRSLWSQPMWFHLIAHSVCQHHCYTGSVLTLLLPSALLVCRRWNGF